MLISLASAASVVLSGVPAYLEPKGCASSAILSILGYYDFRYGATGLLPGIAVADIYLTSNVTVPLQNIALACNTDVSGNTDTGNIGPGLVNYAATVGYNFQVSMSGNVVPSNPHGSQISVTTAYDMVATAITNNQPVLLRVDSNADGVADHLVPVFGYDPNYQELGKSFAFYTGNNESETVISWLPFQAISVGVSYGVSNVAIVIPPTFVPEPSSAIIVLFLGTLMAFRHKRTA